VAWAAALALLPGPAPAIDGGAPAGRSRVSQAAVVEHHRGRDRIVLHAMPGGQDEVRCDQHPGAAVRHPRRRVVAWAAALALLPGPAPAIDGGAPAGRSRVSQAGLRFLAGRTGPRRLSRV
jgi:hypothetical protein